MIDDGTLQSCLIPLIFVEPQEIDQCLLRFERISPGDNGQNVLSLNLCSCYQIPEKACERIIAFPYLNGSMCILTMSEGNRKGEDYILLGFKYWSKKESKSVQIIETDWLDTLLVAILNHCCIIKTSMGSSNSDISSGT